jgi:hypothetical protein
MRAVRTVYIDGASTEPRRVLDVGSAVALDESGLTYKSLFEPPMFEYTGLDMVAGHNVDLVPADPYQWNEVESDSFEHNPYFWITVAEITRVTVPGGLIALIAPSKGFVHRFPLDCWRFLPDSWPAMCAYVGLELVESYRESVPPGKTIQGLRWRDAMMVARKPVFVNEAEHAAFNDRLAVITSTRVPVPTAASGNGPAGELYERTAPFEDVPVSWHPARLARRVARRVAPKNRNADSASPTPQLPQ